MAGKLKASKSVAIGIHARLYAARGYLDELKGLKSVREREAQTHKVLEHLLQAVELMFEQGSSRH